MMFLVGLMGLMAVGATAFYGFDSPAADEDQGDASQRGAGPADAEDTQPDGLTNLLDEPADPNSDTYTGPLVENGTASWGDAEDDRIDGTDALDQINGYAGDDTISGHQAGDILHGDDGDDQLYGDDGNDTLNGGADNDLLWGGADDDALFGHDDDDTLYGEQGNDSLVGSAGDDQLSGGAGDDALHGDLGDDTLTGGDGADTLFGGWGDDVINGYAGPETDDTDVDFLNGGGGDDFIVAGNSDIVTAGDGEDTIALGDWLDQDHQAQILDYTAAEDSLMVVYDDQGGPDPELALESDEDDPTTQHILLNGVRIAGVADAAGLTADQITLVAQTAFENPAAA